LGRPQGGPSGLGRVHPAPEGPRPQRREAVRFRQVHGSGGVLGTVLSRSALATLHGTFLSERLEQGAVIFHAPLALIVSFNSLLCKFLNVFQ